jgi:competence protein ComEA
MPSPVRRRPDPDPLVAARLQAIAYADPYVFVHADDVLEPELWNDGTLPAHEDLGGWVPDPPPRRPATPPPPPSAPAPLLPVGQRWDAVRTRLELAGGGLLALLVLGAVAAAAAGVLLLRARPHATALPSTSHSAGLAVVTSAARTTTPAVRLLVDVTGKVHHPGVFKLPNGSRVIDAVRAAGGALHGTSLNSLNLAAKLADGQQVVVGGSAGPAGTTQPGGSPTADAGLVDLNTATVEQLQTLPGIGPVLAQHIVDYRTLHGPFSGVDGLQQVSGIGPSKFAQLKDHVSA